MFIVRIIRKMQVYLVGNMQNFLMLNQVLHMVATLVYSDNQNLLAFCFVWRLGLSVYHCNSSLFGDI